MPIRHDLHVHSTYSDGSDMTAMADAASTAGLETLGIADHCPVGPDAFERRDRYDLVETYEERRPHLAAVGAETGIDLLDAAEVNYDPRREGRIAAFLDEADFRYTIGSVHYVPNHDVAQPGLREATDAEKRAVVDQYVEWVVGLVESELFDVLGHLDLPQRAPSLRGVMEASHYRRIAAALADSPTVPELNAGRLDRAYGRIHPHPASLPIFANHDVRFVAGSDGHAPEQVPARLNGLSEILDGLPVEYVSFPPAVRELSCSR